MEGQSCGSLSLTLSYGSSSILTRKNRVFIVMDSSALAEQITKICPCLGTALSNMPIFKRLKSKLYQMGSKKYIFQYLRSFNIDHVLDSIVDD